MQGDRQECLSHIGEQKALEARISWRKTGPATSVVWVVHDEFLARCAVWVAGSAEEPGVYGDCGADAGAGDRGKYGAVFGGEWRVAESAAVSGPRPTCGSILEHTLV